MSFREAMPPGPRWGTSVPQTYCAPHLQILATPLIINELGELLQCLWS